MKFEETIIPLSNRARLEQVPCPKIADNVVLFLQTNARKPVFQLEKPMMWIAGLSSVLACSLAILAVILYARPNHPMAEVMETIAWIVQ